MSVFSIGGNAGFATGPLFVTAVLTATGARGILFLAVPAVTTGVAVYQEAGVFVCGRALLCRTVSRLGPDDTQRTGSRGIEVRANRRRAGTVAAMAGLAQANVDQRLRPCRPVAGNLRK